MDTIPPEKNPLRRRRRKRKRYDQLKYREGVPWQAEGHQFPDPNRDDASYYGLNRLISGLCIAAGVPVIRGRWNLQMVRVRDIPKLIRWLTTSYRPMSFDRTSLVIWLAGLEEEIKLLRPRNGCQYKEGVTVAWGYERRLEVEVHRIARLKEPARTIAAVEFVNRIKDAIEVSDVVKQYRKDQLKMTIVPRHPGGYAWWKKLEAMAEGGDRDTDNQRLRP